MQKVVRYLSDCGVRLQRMLMVLVLVTGSVGVVAAVVVGSAVPATAAAQANTYSWPSAPCSWTGKTTGSCVNPKDPKNTNDWYDWGVKSCPSKDSHCGTKINGYVQFDPWGYQFRNCTSYVAEKISQQFGGRSVAGWGNAANWEAAALKAGYHLDKSPQVGDIAVWGTEVADGFGHVAYVYTVSNGVGTFDEYNVAGTGQFTSTYTSQNHPGPRAAPNWYIHMGKPADSGGSSGGSGILSPDLLRSGSFEGTEAGWGTTPPPGGTVNMVDYDTAKSAPAGAHDGQWYLAFNTNGPGGGVYQDVTVNAKAGAAYTGTAWLSSQGGTATGRLCLWGLGATNTSTCIPYSVQAGTYTPIQVTYVAPEAIAKVRFQVYPTPGGGTTDMDTTSLG